MYVSMYVCMYVCVYVPSRFHRQSIHQAPRLPLQFPPRTGNGRLHLSPNTHQILCRGIGLLGQPAHTHTHIYIYIHTYIYIDDRERRERERERERFMCKININVCIDVCTYACMLTCTQ